MHYKTEMDIADKWARRTKLLNFDNLFFIYSDAEKDFREDFLLRYEKLPFEHKIFFSSKPRNNNDCVIFVRNYENATHIGDSTRNRKYEKHIDLIKWLNGEKDFLKK